MRQLLRQTVINLFVDLATVCPVSVCECACACSLSVSLSSIYATHLRASHQLLCISQTHTRPDCEDSQTENTLRALLLSCDKQAEIQIQFTKALKADFNF